MLYLFFRQYPTNGSSLKKASPLQRDIAGMKNELSSHINTSYISFALVRVFRTGAFCDFQNFFEKVCDYDWQKEY